MLTIATIMPPQVLVSAPTWLLFVIFGAACAIVLFGAIVYAAARGGGSNSAPMLACMFTVVVMGVLMLMWTPRVLREQGFTDIDVPLMTVKIMLSNILTFIALLASMFMASPYISGLLRKVASDSHE